MFSGIEIVETSDKVAVQMKCGLSRTLDRPLRGRLQSTKKFEFRKKPSSSVG